MDQQPKVWKNGEKFYWQSQNKFGECVAKFCREGRNAGKPGPCPKDEKIKNHEESRAKYKKARDEEGPLSIKAADAHKKVMDIEKEIEKKMIAEGRKSRTAPETRALNVAKKDASVAEAAHSKALSEAIAAHRKLTQAKDSAKRATAKKK